MIWPMGRPDGPAGLSVPEGYTIGAYVPGDEESFFRLMSEGDFDHFDDANLQFNLTRVIPGGWFFATRVDSGAVCGTAMCLHNYTGSAPFWEDVCPTLLDVYT